MTICHEQFNEMKSRKNNNITHCTLLCIPFKSTYSFNHKITVKARLMSLRGN